MAGDVRTSLLFLRLVERLRRAAAKEFGVSLWTRSAFISRVSCEADQRAYGVVHVDEASDAAFHYSAVLYLHTEGDGFTGGQFAFVDSGAAFGSTERSLTRVAPVQGRAIMFSSGWENVHCVDRITSGVRFAMPVFFGTRAEEEEKEQVAAALCALWTEMGGNHFGES